jgi:hypothetical protein
MVAGFAMGKRTPLLLLVQAYDFEIINDDAGLKQPYMIPIIPKTGHNMKIH